jgi:hypothetical protein
MATSAASLDSGAGELLADELGPACRQAFGGLEHHVADEAVADHDVGRALEDVVAFDVAVKLMWPAAPAARSSSPARLMVSLPLMTLRRC